MWTSPGCVPLRSHAATAAPAKLRALAVGEPGCLASSGDDGERRAHAPHLRRAAPEPDPEPEPWAEAALRDAFAAFPLFGSASAGLWPDSEEEEEDEDDDGDAAGLLAACARRLALGAAGAAAAAPRP